MQTAAIVSRQHTTSDRITYAGHATVLVELGGARLLTDPVLGGGVGPLRRHGPAPAAELVERLDAVLVSHLHRDHADLRSLRRIETGTPLIVPPGAGRFFERRGFAATELAVGESERVGGMTVTAVEAVHAGARLGARGAEAIGFLLSGARSVYFAGDTDLFEGMTELAGDLDLALLPIAGWGPTLGPGHLDPERAARAAALLAPRRVVPIHWGTLYPLGLRRLRPGPLYTPARRFAEALRAQAPQVEPAILEPGESLSLA